MSDPDLKTVLENERAARNALIHTIDQGAAAKDELARTERRLSALEAVEALHHGTTSAAESRFDAAKTAANALTASEAYKNAVKAATTLPGTLTNEDLVAAGDAALETAPVTPGATKYADYDDAFTKAQKEVTDGTEKLIKDRIAVDKAKLDLDAAVDPVLEATAGAEGWLTQGRASFDESVRKGSSSDLAGAWWAMPKATKLLEKFKDPAWKPLDDAEKNLDTQANAYAKAVDELLKAENALPGLVAIRDAAAENLKSAEAIVIAAVARKLKNP